MDEMNDERWQKLLEYFKKQNSIYVTLDAAIELELNELSEEERATYKKEFGLPEASGLDELIKKATSF